MCQNCCVITTDSGLVSRAQFLHISALLIHDMWLQCLQLAYVHGVAASGTCKSIGQSILSGRSAGGVGKYMYTAKQLRMGHVQYVQQILPIGYLISDLPPPRHCLSRPLLHAPFFSRSMHIDQPDKRLLRIALTVCTD